MSLAWATIAITVLLLPGIIFFITLYAPERFTREATPRTALGQLGGVLLISLVVHGFYAAIDHLLAAHGSWAREIDFQVVLGLLDSQGNGVGAQQALAANIEANTTRILAYLGYSVLGGAGLGYFTGLLIASGPLSFLAQHDWVFDLPLGERPGIVDRALAFGPTRLLVDLLPGVWPLGVFRGWIKTVQRTQFEYGYTYAYVLTGVGEQERRLVYQGRLARFGLLSNGRFSYVVISEPRRSYLRLGKKEATVDQDSHDIGSTTRALRPDGGASNKSLLFVEGEDILNIVFDKRFAVSSQRNVDLINEIVKRIRNSALKFADALKEVEELPPDTDTHPIPPNKP